MPGSPPVYLSVRAREFDWDANKERLNIRKLTDERLQSAVVVRNPWMRPPTKTTLERVQIDSDIIFWILRQVGEEGYQDKMNAMLRKAMEDERAARKRSAESD